MKRAEAAAAAKECAGLERIGFWIIMMAAERTSLVSPDGDNFHSWDSHITDSPVGGCIALDQGGDEEGVESRVLYESFIYPTVKDGLVLSEEWRNMY